MAWRTTSEAAAKLGLTPAAVQKGIRSGMVPTDEWQRAPGRNHPYLVADTAIARWVALRRSPGRKPGVPQ